jgi:hypothetical protein
MGQTSLVEMQLQAGQRVIERLGQEGIEIIAGCWAKESESGQWFLYLVTPLVGEDGATSQAYGRVSPLILKMHHEGNWIDPDEVKVIGPTDPIAKDVLGYRRHRPGRVLSWHRGYRLGEMDVEEAYVYPPTTVAI